MDAVKIISKRSFAAIAVLQLFLSGCASVSEPHNQSPENFPSVDAVQKAPDQYRDQRVRWGGTIVSVEHEGDHSVVQVVSRPVSRSSRPMPGDRTDGRFIAIIDGFIDPEIYSAERELTVTGTIESVVDQPLGGTRYLFPVVAVSSHQLWKERSTSLRTYYAYGLSNYRYGSLGGLYYSSQRRHSRYGRHSYGYRYGYGQRYGHNVFGCYGRPYGSHGRQHDHRGHRRSHRQRRYRHR